MEFVVVQGTAVLRSTSLVQMLSIRMFPLLSLMTAIHMLLDLGESLEGVVGLLAVS